MKKTTKQFWHRSENSFAPVEFDPEHIPGALPAGVYDLCQSMRGPFLALKSEKFPMPEKVYGMTDCFQNRVLKHFTSTDRNLGVLLNGIKGTGKTLTAMAICNKIGLPVIVVNQAYPWLGSFISDFEQSAVFFFDEFEKVMKNDSDNNENPTAGRGLLSVMDGASTSGAPKLFLLTTNNVHLDDNFIQRPGRIRYVAKFGNLKPDVIREIVADRLESIHDGEKIVEFISTLEVITTDIVISIIDEVNIHGELPEEWFQYFNVRRNTSKFDVIEIAKDGSKTIVHKSAIVSHKYFGEYSEGDRLACDGKIIGSVKDVVDEWTADIELFVKGRPVTDPKVVTYQIQYAISRHAVFDEAPRRGPAALGGQPVFSAMEE